MNVVLLCYRDDADSFKVILLGELFRVCDKIVGNIFDFAVDLDIRADRKDLLNGALRDKLALAVLILEHDAHPAAREIERDLVFPYISFLKERQVFLLRAVDDGYVHQVLKARLEIAVEERVP